MRRRTAVITGMGCICAAGTSPINALETLKRGRPPLSPPKPLGEYALPFPFYAAPEAMFPGGRRFSAWDTLTLARAAATAALAQAGLPPEGTPAMGVAVGTTAGSALHFLQDYTANRDKEPTFAPPVSPAEAALRGTGAHISDSEDFLHGNLALELLPDGHGPRFTLANACTSGADAVGLALDCIRLGANVMLCGGADTLSLIPHTGFGRLMIYAAEPCRPFDAARKGLNLGEGAAMLVLESETHARSRGARILGRVLGYGAAADAHHFTAPHPQGRGLVQAVTMALANAALTVEDLTFINAHATATPENDKVEGRTLRALAPHTPVWASKGGTGHTLGAAGALEAVLVVQALRQGSVPASWGFTHADPEIGLTPTTQTLFLSASGAREGQGPADAWAGAAKGADAPRPCALSISLGFGGGNAALVLEGESL